MGGRGSKATKQTLHDIFASAARGAGSKVEFYMNFDEKQMEQFKKSKKSLDELFGMYSEDERAGDEWKPATEGSYKDFAIRGDFDRAFVFQEVEAKGEGYQADATNDGVIRVRKDGIDNWEFVIAHEAGHQLSNMSPKLGATIMSNPDDTFGRYNVKHHAFDGIYGEYSPEEAWATAVSVYVRKPSELRAKYPKAYKAVNAFFKKNPSAKTYVKRVLEEYEKRYVKRGN